MAEADVEFVNVNMASRTRESRDSASSPDVVLRRLAVNPSTSIDDTSETADSGRFQRPLDSLEVLDMARGLQYEVVKRPENELEAHRMANNYLFGFRKWKSHVTRRDLCMRSEIVQELYADTPKPKTDVSNINVGNVLYAILIGWWVSLVYVIIAGLMAVTVIGLPHSRLCLKLAKYFLWPFGKFIHKNISDQYLTTPHSDGGSQQDGCEQSPLLNSSSEQSSGINGRLACVSRWTKLLKHKETGYWKRPGTYVWIILGVPVLTIMHFIVFLLTWLTVVFIPVAKINLSAIRRLLLLPPDLLSVHTSSYNQEQPDSDILLYTGQALNVYYYKYTLDGMNVILVNLLSVVIISITLNFADENNQFTSTQAKLVLSIVSFIPLAYFIEMAITSISAQSNVAVGAVLNATFGSIVELILYITALVKGQRHETKCYDYLVKSGLVGTLLATTLLIPGIAMVVGGLKHQTQNFNPRAAGVSATLLFVSVAAAFAPSIFSRAYGTMHCNRCVNSSNWLVINSTDNTTNWGLECSQCSYSFFGPGGDTTFYRTHIEPLVYSCCAILVVAYVIGLIFSLKTHKAHIYDTFLTDVSSENAHSEAQWGRIKSFVILFISTVLISLCADHMIQNITPVLNSSVVSVYFVGVTLFSIVPDIPEIVVGIQFALQNNIALSIEVGSCIAVQVCMLQIPILVVANAIYPVSFYLLFADIHLWSVIIAVLMMNYVFQDGKSNYFQGSALVLSWLALVLMYAFAPNPPDLRC